MNKEIKNHFIDSMIYGMGVLKVEHVPYQNIWTKNKGKFMEIIKYLGVGFMLGVGLALANALMKVVFHIPVIG